MIKHLVIFLLILFLNNQSYATETNKICSIKDVQHKPDDNVNLNDWSNLVPEVVTVPITVDLVDQINQHLVDGLQLETEFSEAQIYSDGRVVIGDKDIQMAVDKLCSEAEFVTEEKPSFMKGEDLFGEGH